MAIKKSELYSTLWSGCDTLRGSMDASQYKDYVLTLLFIKYISDKYHGDPNALVIVPDRSSFDYLKSLKGKPDIGDQINKSISALAEENGLIGVIDLTDFNDDTKLGKGKSMVNRLSDLIGVFENENLDFSGNRAGDDDLLGDAYEYLMMNFATQSGKSKGQFYTPAEVSRILANVIQIGNDSSNNITAYDPTCGSGSLLLKVANEARTNVSLYGQEMDNATKALAVMNMWLHDFPTAEIELEDTLAQPQFKDSATGLLKRFDYIIANPPFSVKNWSNGMDYDPLNDPYERFTGFGVPPAKNGDYAFLLHMVRSLNDNGKAAVILPHGVLFRGNVEHEIRRNLIKKKWIKGIIGLPANLFYGTSIPACIIVLEKNGAEQREGIFIVDAGKGFIKDGNKNRLREQDIKKITDIFNGLTKIDRYSRMVSFDEISENEYNLNIPRYIDSSEKEDHQDIEAHLKGGIPNRDLNNLDAYWKRFPSLKHKLFKTSNREGYSDLNEELNSIRKTIASHSEFLDFSSKTQSIFDTWSKSSRHILIDIGQGSKPKKIIKNLNDQILQSFQGQVLIDRYEVFQVLMSYWGETMQDDCYIIAAEGWQAKPQRIIESKKSKDGKITEKDKGWDCDLVPKTLLAERYFSDYLKELDSLENKKEELETKMVELVEEHSVDDGCFNDLEKINKGVINKHLKEIKDVEGFEEDVEIFKSYIHLMDLLGKAKKEIKSYNSSFDKILFEKYPVLTKDEIKSLVINDKWLSVIKNGFLRLIDQVVQELNNSIVTLDRRYKNTLPELNFKADQLEKKVEDHLKKMGFEW